MLRTYFIFCIFLNITIAAGWSIVGDTFTDEKGKCEFDFWLHGSHISQNLGFYTDCVISKTTSLQIASNTSTQSLENQAFLELEQAFFTTQDNFFNIGIILGNGFGRTLKKLENNFYSYIPLSFNWLDQKLRTTLNIGMASNHNFMDHFFTLSASISGNITDKIWLVGEVSTATREKIYLNSSFYQVGASFLIHKDNISIDIAYLNSLNHSNFGSIKIGMAFYVNLF